MHGVHRHGELTPTSLRLMYEKSRARLHVAFRTRPLGRQTNPPCDMPLGGFLLHAASSQVAWPRSARPGLVKDAGPCSLQLGTGVTPDTLPHSPWPRPPSPAGSTSKAAPGSTRFSPVPLPTLHRSLPSLPLLLLPPRHQSPQGGQRDLKTET